MSDGVHAAFWVTTADPPGSSGPRAGSGSGQGGGKEAGRGFGSEVLSPAVAP